MIKKILTVSHLLFNNPQKFYRYLIIYIKSYIRKKKHILFFLGMGFNGQFDLIFRSYEKCFCFEPNPYRYKKLINKYKKYPNVHIYNVALSNYDGIVKFNISNNNGASSSIGSFDEAWAKKNKNKIKIIDTIEVECINLYNFCLKNNIDKIDDYISDIQGMDLEVLKTMKPMIMKRKIDTITCEVTRNNKHNVYQDLPDNTENGFYELLNNNYELIANGSGLLTDFKFDNIKDDWEFDCKWKVKLI